MALAINQTGNTSTLAGTESPRLSSALETGLKTLVDEYFLNSALVGRYQAQIADLLAASACGIPQSRSPATDTISKQPWGWRPFLESPDIAVGMLTVFADQGIPLHDHPGSSGLLLVLNGRVQIRSYKLVGSADIQEQPPLELEKTAEKVLLPGDQWHFGPNQNNIHTLSAPEDECEIFDVLFSPYQAQQRSFFMPIVPGTNSDNLFVVRLNKLRNMSTSHREPSN